MILNNKQDFERAYFNNELGNRLKSWQTLKELLNSDYRGLVSIRSRQVSGTSYYNVPIDSIANKLGKSLNEYYFNESAPDDHLIIQGEYFHGTSSSGTFHNRSLMYSEAPVKMKEFIKLPEGRGLMCRHFSEGITTNIILQHYMNANSYDDFQILQEQYPDHVIEFGIYNHELGIVPHRNTIIWEVRQY
jgi:hypothetical protein